MRSISRRVVPVVAAALVCAALARAQRQPHIGYLYPAGAQRGTTCEITIGGQYLAGVNAVCVSGAGVRAEVIEHIKPLTRKQLGMLRAKMRELQKRLQAARKRGQGSAGKGNPRPPRDTAPIMWEGKNLAAMSRVELAKLRKKLFDPRKQLNPQIAEKVRVRVALDPGADPGEVALRLLTPAGLTNPLEFEISPWPEHREVEPNDAVPDGAIGDSSPVVVNGQILPGDIDRFRFAARAGEHLVAAASARKLIPYLADAVPGWFQATLGLYDDRGRELAFVDDYRFDPDPVLHFEIPADGQYVLEIRDAIYRGREDFVYRIALGELPFVTSIFPLGGRAGAGQSVAVSGWNLPAAKLARDAGWKAPGVRSIAEAGGERLANRVPFAVGTLPESLEVEPNEEARSAQPIDLPRIVNGRIDRPGDVDTFRIEGRAGQQIVAEVHARRLGSPLDSELVLRDSAGAELAANDDFVDPGAGLTTHQADSRLVVTLPAGGLYYLHLRDVQHRGGEAYAYRLRISPPQPDFELRIVPASINLRAGATIPLRVVALRRDGFAGDIALALKDAPPGFALSGGWVPAGQDRVSLTLTAPATPLQGPVHLRLEGRARIGGRQVRRPAVPAEDMMQAFLYRHLVPEPDLMAAVTAGKAYRMPLRFLAEEPVKLPTGKVIRISMAGPRRAPRTPVDLELIDPPAGITVGKVSIGGPRSSILLRCDGDQAVVGLKGNLIFQVFIERTAQAKKGQKKPARKRRVLLGTLPALRFEVVAG